MRAISWIRLRMTLLVTPVIAAAFSMSASCYAQIGRFRQEFSGSSGYEADYSGPVGAFGQAFRTKRASGGKFRTTYLLNGGRVSAVRLNWASDVSLNEALASAEKTTGLSALAPAKRKNAPDWIIDRHQTSRCPVLGASEPRTVTRPVAKVPVGMNVQWTGHYSKWGQLVGKSDIAASPVFATYSVWTGQFQFAATKAFLPIMRSDGSRLHVRRGRRRQRKEDALHPRGSDRRAGSLLALPSCGTFAQVAPDAFERIRSEFSLNHRILIHAEHLAGGTSDASSFGNGEIP